MADIKSLGIFGSNKGLEKMKKAAAQEEKTTSPIKNVSIESKATNKKVVSKNTKGKIKGTKGRSSGAPIRKFDRVYAAKQPLKLSPLLNSTSRILVEKYETNISRDELLRQALDLYIKQNMSQEDKLDLFNDVIKDLNLFREAKPENATVPEIDENGNVLRSVEEIQADTEKDIIQNWGLNKR